MQDPATILVKDARTGVLTTVQPAFPVIQTPWSVALRTSPDYEASPLLASYGPQSAKLVERLLADFACNYLDLSDLFALSLASKLQASLLLNQPCWRNTPLKNTLEGASAATATLTRYAAYFLTLNRLILQVDAWYKLSPDDFQPGATLAHLEACEAALGFPMHPHHKLWLSIRNGQPPTSHASAMLMGFRLLSSEEIPTAYTLAFPMLEGMRYGSHCIPLTDAAGYKQLFVDATTGAVLNVQAISVTMVATDVAQYLSRLLH